MSAVDSAREWFAGATVGIVGLGREGTALARFLLPIAGAVLATDDKLAADLPPQVRELAGLGLALHPGGLSEAVLESDCLFVSPGVPLDVPLLTAAIDRGIPLWNEPGLFLALCPAVTFGVTGSMGKSTTAALVAAVLRAPGRRVWLGGNIGTPLIEAVAEMAPEDAVVMELSSFQLELARQSPRHALITNLSPNHLDRHGSMAGYVLAKAEVFRYQSGDGVLSLNGDDAWCRWLAPTAPGRLRWFSARRHIGRGAYLEGEAIMAGEGALGERVCRADELKLPGRHNVANALAATAMCAGAGVAPVDIRRGLVSFEGLPHRLERVAVVAAVSYYNDSIATTPERSIAGMRAIDAPVILLAGGRDKHLPWKQWAEEAQRRARAVIAFGECGPTLREALAPLQVPVVLCGRLREAVQAARQAARPGDAVLLSPGGTSFDEFRDFAERGDCFRAVVLEMERSR